MLKAIPCPFKGREKEGNLNMFLKYMVLRCNIIGIGA